jgi:hypothetical protein
MLISTSLLTGVLALAVWTDLKSRRIPNALVAMGLCLALASVSMGWGSVSLSQCLLGALTGLVLFLPLYLFGAVGAGDAKLMAAVGAFVGPYAVLWAAVYTALFGATQRSTCGSTCVPWQFALPASVHRRHRICRPVTRVCPTHSPLVRAPWAGSNSARCSAKENIEPCVVPEQ